MKNDIFTITENKKKYYKGVDIGSLIDVKSGKYYYAISKDNKKTIEYKDDEKTYKSVFLNIKGVQEFLNKIYEKHKNNVVVTDKIHNLKISLKIIKKTKVKKKKENPKKEIMETMKSGIAYDYKEEIDRLNQHVKKIENILQLQSDSINYLTTLIKKQKTRTDKVMNRIFIKNKKRGH